jgi:hypothetical protein
MKSIVSSSRAHIFCESIYNFSYNFPTFNSMNRNIIETVTLALMITPFLLQRNIAL